MPYSHHRKLAGVPGSLAAPPLRSPRDARRRVRACGRGSLHWHMDTWVPSQNAGSIPLALSRRDALHGTGFVLACRSELVGSMRRKFVWSCADLLPGRIINPPSHHARVMVGLTSYTPSERQGKETLTQPVAAFCLTDPCEVAACRHRSRITLRTAYPYLA